MRELNAELKEGIFHRVYLLYGPEAYLRLQYTRRLADAAVPADDLMNRTVFEGKNVSEEEVIDLAETVPMFSERRLILLRDTGFLKGRGERLAEYVGQLPEYLVMVFVEEEADKRSRLFKAIQQNGRVTEFPIQEERVLKSWVAKLFRDAGKQISPAVLQRFLEETGTDMTHIYLEADKLIWYAGDRDTVTDADLEAVTGRSVENRIFDMVRAVSEQNADAAFAGYADLLTLKESPMRILYLVARQYRQLLVVSEMSGRSEAEIAKAAQIPEFVVRRSKSLLRRYGKRQLLSILAYCNSMEEDVKNGRITDRLCVELVLSKLCGRTSG